MKVMVLIKATLEELSPVYPGRKLQRQRIGAGLCRGDADHLGPSMASPRTCSGAM
jgi:hypothetical protein